MILELPVRPAPAHSFQTSLDGRSCSIRLVWRGERLYCDLMADNVYVWQGLIVRDRTPLKNFRILRFDGDFVFIDHEGENDPHYAGLGTRYRMYYITDDVRTDDSFQRRGTDA